MMFILTCASISLLSVLSCYSSVYLLKVYILTELTFISDTTFFCFISVFSKMYSNNCSSFSISMVFLDFLQIR